MTPNPSVRRCKNPACRAEIIRKPHENFKQFATRDHCDRECQYRVKHPQPESKEIMSDKEQREIDRENQKRRDEIGTIPLAEVVERLHPTAAWLFR